MKRFFCVLSLAAAMVSCSDGFGRPRGQRRLVVELVSGNVQANGACVENPDCAEGLGCVQRGTDRTCVPVDLRSPRPVRVEGADVYRIVVRALRLDGTQDEGFTGFVRISAKPGSIDPILSPGAEGRNVLLEGGVSQPVDVRLVNAYGTTYILADDIGYQPSDPFGEEPPACSNGRDDDGDGLIDFPADDGCAFPNDADERGGSFAQGASPPIFYGLPRIAQVRGVDCTSGTCRGTGLTPYPKEQIQVDTGYREGIDGPAQFVFDVVVTRISSDGFYSQDLNNDRPSTNNPFGGDTRFSGIFAFNFNAPPRMRVCDRLKTLTGTANEFFGFTQISYPTWTLEEWDPAARLCLVPEPEPISPSDAVGAVREANLLPKSGKLVRVRTQDPNPGQAVRPTEVYITPKLGPGDAQRDRAGFILGPDNTNCDFNKDGRIDFSDTSAEAIAQCNDLSLVPMPAFCEGVCSSQCDADPECSEFSNFRSRSTFRLLLKDANGVTSAIQADASAFAGFNPLEHKGRLIRSFSGTLHYFSGGSQLTIEARCRDDVVLELERMPPPTDRECADDAECSGGFRCLPLDSGQRACRALDSRERPSVPPPLSCVFPRTFLDNNPQ